MTVSDAARIYRVSERTLRRWSAEGRLATVKRGGATHVSPAGVEAILARGHARPNPAHAETLRHAALRRMLTT